MNHPIEHETPGGWGSACGSCDCPWTHPVTTAHDTNAAATTAAVRLLVSAVLLGTESRILARSMVEVMAHAEVWLMEGIGANLDCHNWQFVPKSACRKWPITDGLDITDSFAGRDRFPNRPVRPC